MVLLVWEICKNLVGCLMQALCGCLLATCPLLQMLMQFTGETQDAEHVLCCALSSFELAEERPQLNISIDCRFVSDYFVDAHSSTSVPQQSSLAAGAEEESRRTVTEALSGTEQILEAPCARDAEEFDKAGVRTEQERIVDIADVPVTQSPAHTSTAESDQADRDSPARPTQCYSTAVAHGMSSSFSNQPKISSTAKQTAEALDSSEAPSTGLQYDSVEQQQQQQQQQHQQHQQSVVLERIWVYPIKSCAGFAPESWPLGQNGLLYDREWALVDAEGVALTQKKLPRLATVRPNLNMDAGMILQHPCSVAVLVMVHMSAFIITSSTARRSAFRGRTFILPTFARQAVNLDCGDVSIHCRNYGGACARHGQAMHCASSQELSHHDGCNAAPRNPGSHNKCPI